MQKEKYIMVQRPLLICSNHLKLTNIKMDSSQALHIVMLLVVSKCSEVMSRLKSQVELLRLEENAASPVFKFSNILNSALIVLH